MAARSKLSASPSQGVQAKNEIIQRKQAIREKYVTRGALNRREKFLSALKAIFYVLGGPLVWIFWSASNKKR